MRSVATRRFWELFRALPSEVQELASLRFRRLQGSEDPFSIRVGDHYRALGRLSGEKMIWVWIGTHAEHDRVVGS